VSRASIPRAARAVSAEWARLAAPSHTTQRFALAMTGDLPAPARRWVTHAIAPGTPLWRSATLRMHGHIRLGSSWRTFHARQVIAPPDGNIWAATARFVGLPVVGFDRYTADSGQMRWRLLDIVPVMTASGHDVTRSAAGRLAGEFVLVPTSFARASWTAGSTDDTAVATWTIGGEPHAVELEVGPGGSLRSVLLQRWGNPGGAAYGSYPFGVAVQREATFGGVTIPAGFRAGWWWGTDRQDEGEFFRAHITDAAFS